MARVILERTFDSALSDAEKARLDARAAPCLEVNRVRWIRSCFSLDRQRLICEFDAPDAEALRTALRTARLRYDRVWSGEVVVPESESTEARE